MRCPKCRGVLEDDGSCSCGYGVKRRQESTESHPTGPTPCRWSDYGRSCPSRGILSPGTHGEGPWYCREHFDTVSGIDPLGVGNYPVEPTKAGATEKWAGWFEKWRDDKNRRQLPKPMENI